MTRLWLMSLKGTDIMGSCNRGTPRASENGRKSQRRKKIPRSLSCWLWRRLLATNSTRRWRGHLASALGWTFKCWEGEILFHHDLGQLTSSQWVWIFPSIRSIGLNVSQSPFLLYAGESTWGNWLWEQWQVNRVGLFYLLSPHLPMRCFFQVFHFSPKMWATDSKDWGLGRMTMRNLVGNVDWSFISVVHDISHISMEFGVLNMHSLYLTRERHSCRRQDAHG